MTNAIFHLAGTSNFLSERPFIDYLGACTCNLLFEQGLHSIIDSQDYKVLENMKLGYSYFSDWHEELLAAGMSIVHRLYCALIIE